MKLYTTTCTVCGTRVNAYTSDIRKRPQCGHRFPGSVTRQYILDEAAKCVNTDRNAQYGEPEDSFRMIAELWEPYIRQKCVSAGADVCVCAEDVAAMMALFKISRIATGQKKQTTGLTDAGILLAAERFREGMGCDAR